MIHDFPNRQTVGVPRPAPVTVSHQEGRLRIRAVIHRVAFFTFLACGLQLVCAGTFDPPNLEGFNLHFERDADGDGDGTKETHIRQYMNPHGDSIFSMTTNGRLWAWSLDTRDKSTGVRNYVIRDSDCDGIFDEVYGLDEEFHVPDCVK